MEHILQKFLIFSENYVKTFDFSILMERPYKPRKFSGNSIIYLRNLSKKTQQNWRRSRRTIGKGMKILEITRKSTVICKGIQKKQHLNFHQAAKIQKPGGKVCVFGPKMKKVLKKKFEIFGPNLR